MTLRWKGKLYGREVEGHVQAGAIFGPLEVISAVEAHVSAGTRVGFGPWAGAANLTDLRAARGVIAAVLDHGTVEFEGDPVPVEPVPEGADA